jgi:hypothetical protein
VVWTVRLFLSDGRGVCVFGIPVVDLLGNLGSTRCAGFFVILGRGVGERGGSVAVTGAI